jgi:signal transduction histidine kinase
VSLLSLQTVLTGLCWVACLFSPVRAEASNVDIHVTRAETLVVEGRGFSPPPYNLAAPGALPIGAWRQVELPNVEAAHLLPGSAESGAPPTVVAWYRVLLPPLPALLQGDLPRYLYIPRWKSDGQIAVYGDDRLLYQSHANLLWNGSNHPLWIALTDTAAAPTPTQITLRIERLRNNGAVISSLRVGDEVSIGWRYRIRTFLQNQLVAMSSAAFLAIGLFALVVWIRGQGGQLYFLFFAMSVVSFARSLHAYVGVQHLPWSDEWFGWLTVASMFWFVAITHFFLRLLHGQARPLLDRIVFIHTIAISVLTLPPVTGAIVSLWPAAGIAEATVIAPLLYSSLVVLVPITIWADLASAWKQRSADAMALASWAVVAYLLGCYDWLQQNNLIHIEGSYLAPYGSVGIFVLFMIIMLRHYTRAIDGVREANAHLESRLREREAELVASHTRLREVEQRELLAHERQRLMQDMHDGLGSSLVSALRVVESGRLNDVQVSDVIKGCIDDLRLAIDSMEPMEADLLLLLATLRFRLGPRLASAGVQLQWSVVDVPKLEWLEPHNTLHVLRILQEAFANILKHTRATEICVATTFFDGQVLVTVSDNGSGFDVEAMRADGARGLANQQRRARVVGGTVAIASGAAGTQFTLRLPVVHSGEA